MSKSILWTIACTMLLLVACSRNVTTAIVPSPTPTSSQSIRSPQTNRDAIASQQAGDSPAARRWSKYVPETIWSQHLSYARDRVGEWGYVTELVRLDDLDPARWQVLFDLCARLHLKPILRLATSYDRDKGLWLAHQPTQMVDYATVAGRYAHFVAALRWPDTPHYVIVGNEPNHGDEWGGKADPLAYAHFLMATSRALHQADPDVKVLNAPLDPFTPNTNGKPFTDGMTYLDAESFLDAMHAAQPMCSPRGHLGLTRLSPGAIDGRSLAAIIQD